ncbi:MAG: TIM barrel protein, partial [Verrucomicrobiota bacterium]
MSFSGSRREFLHRGIAASGGVLALPSAVMGKSPERFSFCLNTSTIRGQKVGIEREIEIAAETGYDGIEPWLRDITAYVDAGGSLDDLRKKIEDLGLTIESAIGFASWVVDDEEKRAQGFEQAKQDMNTLAQLGGIRMAAPP